MLRIRLPGNAGTPSKGLKAGTRFGGVNGTQMASAAKSRQPFVSPQGQNLDEAFWQHVRSSQNKSALNSDLFGNQFAQQYTTLAPTRSNAK